MPTPIHWIEGITAGRLGISAHPRGGNELESDLAGWLAAGVGVIVSVLANDEVRDLRLTNEKALCRVGGITFRNLAIPHLGVPPSNVEATRLIAHIVKDLHASKSVLIHSNHGLGRSSMIAAAVMQGLGSTVGDAFQAIGNARGQAVPETEEQRQWVEAHALARVRA